MFKENKDDLARKIIIYVFFIDLFLTFVFAITMLALGNNQELAYLKNIIRPILIIGVSLVIVFFIFCVIEIVLKKAMNEKIKLFIKNKEFNKGINYIENFPKIKVFYDIYERQFYYIALLNLYLDNIEKAKTSFYNININSSMVDIGVFVNTTLYLLLICEENCEAQDKEFIKDSFNRNIVAVKKNKYQYQKNANNIATIQKILDGDLSNMDSILQDKLEIPLVKRILIK
jgi:hypothetical protein